MIKRFVSLSLAVFCCICVLVATERRAYAYINPGDGMMALQSLGAVLATAGYMLRSRIAVLFGRVKPEDQPVKTMAPRVALPTAASADSKRSAA